jgi:hypothetical protein
MNRRSFRAVFLLLYLIYQLLQSSRKGCAFPVVQQSFTIPSNRLDGVMFIVTVTRIRWASAYLYREK